MNKNEEELLGQLADLQKIKDDSYNIRVNGQRYACSCDEACKITPKEDKPGIDIFVQRGTKNRKLHIPVIITVGNLTDLVYNDFYIEDDCDVEIVAGCGIHNPTDMDSSHNGIHSFHIGNNCKVIYYEKHIGIGTKGKKILNPTTNVELKENSTFTMDTIQTKGVSSSVRETYATIHDNSTLYINEKIMTQENETASTKFEVNLIGKNSRVEVVSRAIAQDESEQSFVSNLVGQNACFGHVECDGILQDKAIISSTPQILAKHVDALLVHEAAIGKINEQQVVKLMTLGLSKEDAEQKILEGFLNG